jgi:hypothetical protein
MGRLSKLGLTNSGELFFRFEPPAAFRANNLFKVDSSDLRWLNDSPALRASGAQGRQHLLQIDLPAWHSRQF